MFHVGWVDLEGHHRSCPTQLGLEPLPVFASPCVLILDGEFCSLCSVFALIWEFVLFSADALSSWCVLNPCLKLWHVEVQDESLVSVSEATNVQARAPSRVRCITGSSPSPICSSWTKSQRNPEEMAKVCMAGEPGQDPAFAVTALLSWRNPSLCPLQLLLL